MSMSDYIYTNGGLYNLDELQHYGVKGMKWGVRRYQNKDGSLTDAGRQRVRNASSDKKFKDAEQSVRERSTNSYSAFNKQKIDIDSIKARSGLGDTEAILCASLATRLFDKASLLEPQITNDVVNSVSNSSGKMYGLEYRLKQPSSIAGKIGSDSKDKQTTFLDASSGIKDVIRYTAVSEDKDFVKNYNRIKKNLNEKGYSEVRCKNYFEMYRQGKVMHKAVQCTYQTKNGYQFELQFQTPSSQAAKELKVPIYEERRRIGISEQRVRALESEMVGLAERVSYPPNISSIENK
jgi:hypothetical protein